MSRRAACWYLLCLGFIALVGCRDQTPSSTAAKGTGGPAPTLSSALNSTTKTSEPITSGEYYDFCIAAETEAATGDTAGLDARFDMDAMLATAMKGLELSKKSRAGIERGFRSAVARRGLGAQIVEESGAGGLWKLLRVHKQQGATLAWFRMKGAGGINYHHLLLTKNAAGEIKVTDMYVMMAGEMMTNTFRRTLLPSVASENRSLLDKMLSSESDYIKHFKTVAAFQKALSAGDGPEAKRQYALLPASVQADKTMLLLYLKACRLTEDWEQYPPTLEKLRALSPGDANADLLAIDIHLFKQEFAKAEELLDRIDAVVGGDPYLDEQRASFAMQAGDYARAKTLGKKVTQLSPPSLDAFWILVSTGLKEPNHDDVLFWLTQIQEHFVFEFEDLSTVPDYAGFVQSPQYQVWLQRQKEPSGPRIGLPANSPAQ